MDGNEELVTVRRTTSGGCRKKNAGLHRRQERTKRIKFAAGRSAACG